MNDTYTFFIHTFFIHTYILYNDTFFIYHSWYTSNFETTDKKPPFYHGNYFFSDVVLVSNYHGCKGETIKKNTLLYDRYYLQNCKAIPFEKNANHTKYKEPNVPINLHIF